MKYEICSKLLLKFNCNTYTVVNCILKEQYVFLLAIDEQYVTVA
jgi:hypothetical protein